VTNIGKPHNYGDIHNMEEGKERKAKKRENLIMAKSDKNEASLIQFTSSHWNSLLNIILQCLTGDIFRSITQFHVPWGRLSL